MLDKATRLKLVRSDLPPSLMRRAAELEAVGHLLIKLHIGNPPAWGIHAPDAILHDVVQNIGSAQGYSDARGIYTARVAVAQYYQDRGILDMSPDDVYLGNGVSELVPMCLQALLNPGDEVLVPAPDYPLWTAATVLASGSAVHYRCDEASGWAPDLDHLAACVTDRTRALVVINPNNPTGAVYSRETLLGLVGFAQDNDLVIFADEVYDKITYDGAEHHSLAALAPDLVVLTMSGLSKSYRAAGFRAGWLTISGPRRRARDYLEGLQLLANMRLCPNVPAQYAIQTALHGFQSIEPLVQPGGRLHAQRERAWRAVSSIDGVTCAKPMGAVYLFPRLDPDVYVVDDDEKLALDLLEQERLLVTNGSSFSLATQDHLRMTFLPPVDVIDEVVARLARFLSTIRR